MRRTSALILTGTLAALVLTLGAHAGASPVVDRQAWARTGPAAPPSPRDGHLYVSTAAGREQARSFLHVDSGSLTAAGLADAAIVLAAADDAVLDDRASLVACALAAPLTASGELASAPGTDCSLRTDLTRRADGSWVLPVAVFAARWAEGDNPGVAVFPDPEQVSVLFTVAFDTTKTHVEGIAAPPPAPPPRTAVSASTEVSPSTAPHRATVATTVEPSSQVIVQTDESLTAPHRTARPVQRASARRDAPHPPALAAVAMAVIAGALTALWSRRPRSASMRIAMPNRVLGEGAAWLALPAALMTLGEATVYKLGLIGVVFIAAIGLHLLVNWTGELSLGHAGFIGVPAFVVAQFSSHSGLSPLVALPFAVAVGLALGSLVGVAALRSRGLQVALVTLAFGIAIGQFLFVRTWLVGPSGGLQVPVPSILGHEIRTSRALLPLLAATVLLAVCAARSIMRSTMGRAMLLLRVDPAAAAAAGVPVARQRALAYALAGGFAGTAGWAYVVWVQQVSAKAFPLQLGFTYLVIAALAGPGGLAGVAIAALMIQGGALFSILPHSVALYLGPIALIINVTRYQAGFNGVLRAVRSSLGERRRAPVMRTSGVRELRLGVVFGVAAIVGGFAAIALGWYHMGNTGSVWVQNQELMSGGVAGLGLIIVGSAFLLRDALLTRRALENEDEPVS